MRVCFTCKSSYEEFGQKRNICRPCKQAYDRDYHRKRTDEAKALKLVRQKERVQENREKVWSYLEEHPCETCGESDPIVLEFDHIDQASKEYNVSEMSTLGWDKIHKEILKCRVLCANCHRRHTAIQLGWRCFNRV